MTQLDRFGDFFYEVPEAEIYPMPGGGHVSSECVINSLGLTYTIEVIPREPMIRLLRGRCPEDSIALGFFIEEEVGTGQAWIYTEKSPLGSRMLARITADSLPVVKQLA